MHSWTEFKRPIFYHQRTCILYMALSNLKYKIRKISNQFLNEHKEENERQQNYPSTDPRWDTSDKK